MNHLEIMEQDGVLRAGNEIVWIDSPLELPVVVPYNITQFSVTTLSGESVNLKDPKLVTSLQEDSELI